MNDQRKKGISLIVLVITIIIIVILAVSVILTLANNNPIENAKRAVFQNDINAMQEELSLYTLSNKFVELNPSQLYADENVLMENGEKIEGKTIKDVITSIKDKYLGKIRVIGGKLDYVAVDNLKELAWANEILQRNSNLNYKVNEVENSYNINLLNVKSLESLKIYGNSIQNGDPTPNTPIEVESVGVKTKNLFDKDNAEVLNLTMLSGSFTTSSTAKLVYIPCKPSTTYTISRLSGNSFAVSNSIEKPGANVTYTIDGKSSFINFTDNVTEGTYTTSASAKYLAVIIEGSSTTHTYQEIIDSMQIEEGDTATDYEPYGYKIPVTVKGKNYANYLRVTSAQYNHKYEMVDNGFILEYVEGKINARSASIPCKLKAGVKYRLSVDYEHLGTVTPPLKAFFAGFNQYFNVNSTVIPKQDVTSFNLYVDAGDTYVEGVKIKITNIQFEEGSTKTDYEPYIEPITTNIYIKEPLRKVGSYTDYIDLVNKIKVRNVKGLRLTSDLNWSTAQSSDGNYYHYCEIDDILQTASDQSIRCNAYSVTSKNTTSENNKICYRENMDGFVIVNNSYTSVEDFKSYLDENNVYVEYPINTTKELLQMPTIILNKGTNIATVGTTVSPSKISSIYDQDI